MKTLRMLALSFLLLAFLLPFTALADTTRLTEETIFQTASDGENVFLLVESGVLVCSADGDVQSRFPATVITDVTMQEYMKMSAAEKARIDAGITHILAGDDGLWGINAYVGLAGRLDAEGVHFLETAFDTSEWFNDEDCPADTPLSGFVEEGTVYILRNNSLQMWQTSTASERKVAIQATLLQCIPYQPHKALLNVMVLGDDWDTALYVLDLDTWSIEALVLQMPELASAEALSIGRVAYHAKEQRLVIQVRGNDFAEDGLLCESVGGAPWEKVALVNEMGSMYLLSGGKLMWIRENQASTYRLDELSAADVVTLDMKGLLHQDLTAYQQFCTNYPGVTLRKSNTTLDSADVKSLVNHSEKPDVLSLYANQLYADIVRKGYALPLGEENVSALLEDLYPLFSSLLKNSDGKIVAMPTMVSVNLLSVNTEVWNETFGADTPFPTTYQELFSLMIAWEEEYANDYADVNITDDWDMETLLSRMIEQYVLTYEQSGEPLLFDTPVFVETVDTFVQLLNCMNQTRFEQNALQGYATMFSTCNLNSLFSMDSAMDDETTILQPFQIDASEQTIRTDVVVLVANGFTKYPAEAEALIAHLAQKEYLSVETRCALFASENQPVTFTQGKKERKITTEGLSAYQKMLPYMKLSAASRYLSQSDRESSFTASIQSSIEQLVRGNINAEQFAKQIDRISSMLWMEAQ